MDRTCFSLHLRLAGKLVTTRPANRKDEPIVLLLPVLSRALFGHGGTGGGRRDPSVKAHLLVPGL